LLRIQQGTEVCSLCDCDNADKEQKKGWLKIKNPEHVQIICFNDPFSSCRFLKIDGTDWGQVKALKKECNTFLAEWNNTKEV
jgi:hypothetical protein